MAKATVSREHAALYPELKDLEGQTVDASVIQRAVSNAKVRAKDSKKVVAPKVASSPAPAKKKSAPRKKAVKKVA